MHHIHHTEGLILESSDFGESGKRYTLFTRDLGMVYARANGVRTMSSKLRYVLTDFAYVKVDLVQGKNYWRVTSASRTDRLEHLTKNRDALRVFGNISRLLRRLLVATEPNEKLFFDLVAGLSILETARTREEIDNIEAILVLRQLADLGYIGGDGGLAHLIESPIESELIYAMAASRRQALREINKALRESQL